MLIFLIGFMGSGKSHNGKKLARTLKYKFIDLDHYLEKKADLTITQIFERYGEEYFRTLEQECLHEMADRDNIVVATGGGAPCYFDNMDWMNQRGITIFLQPSVNILVDRLLPGTNYRPLLKGKSTLELRYYITEKLKERLPFYSKAQHTISISRHNQKVVNEILELLDKNS